MKTPDNGTDIYFLTGNYNKFLEIKTFIPTLKQLDIDLEEIQSLYADVVIKAKLNEAAKYYRAQFIVEDTSLYLDCLNGLPGPLIKWFMQALGCKGLFQMAEKMGNTSATAKTIIGYAKNPEEIIYFEGSIKGSICAPKGENGFGWDPVFVPYGCKKSLAEMTDKEKNEISMRRIALNKFKAFVNA